MGAVVSPAVPCPAARSGVPLAMPGVRLAVPGTPHAAAFGPSHHTGVYKALSVAAYGGEKEEAGALLSKSPRAAGSLLPGTVQASRPSREGQIIAMRTQLSQATQRRKR